MQSPLTEPEQNALLDALLVAARADARSFAAQAGALVQLNNLAAREELELSRVAQFPVLELAGTLLLSQQALSSRSAEAQRLVSVLPRTLAALAGGELLVPQAKALLEVTKNTAPPVASRVEAALLPELLGWDAPEVRRRAAAMVLQVEAELDLQHGTDTAGDRLAAARANRKVTVRPEPDGMAGLWELLPAEQAVRFRRDLDELARRAKLSDLDAGVTRTADQRRADLLAALPGLVLRGHAACQQWRAGAASLGTPVGGGPVGGNSIGGNSIGGGPVGGGPASTGPAGAGPAGAGPAGGNAAHGPCSSGSCCGGGCSWGGPALSGANPVGVLLNVLVPMDTVVDRGVQPATLTGYGPISAAHVRLLRPAAWVRPIYVDSRSGQPIALGGTIYPPQAGQPGQPEYRARPEQAGPPGQAEQAEQPRALGQGHQADQTDQPDQLDRPDQIKQVDQPDPLNFVDNHSQQRPDPDQRDRRGSKKRKDLDGSKKRKEPGGNAQHRSRPVTWDEQSFRAVLQSFLQPVEITDRAEPQHDPSRRLTRLLQLRDVRCAGPGCSVPAQRCDRDHRIPYGTPGGVTAAWNLRHLSRRCHRAKHHGWTLTPHPEGRVSWQSPLGRTYHRPAPHQRPEPTDWTRWDTSPRHGPTGLQLIPAKGQPTRHGSPATDCLPSEIYNSSDTGSRTDTDRRSADTSNTSNTSNPGSIDTGDQDWDWGHGLTGCARSNGDLPTSGPAGDDAPPF